MPARQSLPFVGLGLNTLDDFFAPGAPLEVRNAAAVRRHVREVVEALDAFGAPAVLGLDAHAPDDPEFAGAGLAAHAVAGAPGRTRIAEAAARRAPVIPADGQRRPWPDIATWRHRGGPLILEKSRFDLFSNPACGELLRSLFPDELVCFGATFEHDLRATALSARTFGLAVTLVEDAAGVLDPAATGAVRAELESRGVTFELAEALLLRLAEYRQREERRRRTRIVSEGKPA